jgi:PLD-like domain
VNTLTSVESVSRRYAYRPGCRFVGAQEVGIAVFLMDLRVIVLDPKEIPPIDEFLLRSIGLQVEQPPELATFLGLDERTVENRLVELRRAELIEIAAGRSKEDVRCRLTIKGKSATDSLQRAELKEITIPRVVFHGFLRRPVMYPEEQLLRPKELRDFGFGEIVPIPARYPRPEEIKLEELSQVIRQQWQQKRKGKPPELVTVRSILRDVRTMYIPAVLLQYELLGKKKQVQVAFAVNGLLEEEYARAFAGCKGPERIPELLAADYKTTAELAHELLKPHIVRKLGPLADVDELVEQLQVIDENVATKEGQLEAQSRPDTKQVLREELERERTGKAELEKKLTDRKVSRLRVFDCKHLLATTLRDVKERLVIVSAFLSSAVVDREFLLSLESALARGVKVWIAYGMGPQKGRHAERDVSRENSAEWKEAERGLKELRKKHEGSLQLLYPGFTHEKILIRDKSFVASGSFNWLSYKGERGRQKRYEDALKVTESTVIEEYFNEITGRFPKTL